MKGKIDEVLNEWERAVILLYAEKLGWGRSMEILGSHELSYCGDARLQTEVEKLFGKDVAEKYSKRTKRTMFIQTLRQSFSEEDEAIRITGFNLGAGANPATKEDFLELYEEILNGLDVEE